MVSSAALLVGITLLSCPLLFKESQARAGCASTGHDNVKFYCPTRHSCERLLLGLQIARLTTANLTAAEVWFMRT